ncbi:tetratricopeptide repeat protein [Streptomyces sp. Je 1-332]|uniref:tetratricopeptide repeat protein n=1 Tax=Streptomyces sp. Je 1-332 TaxID=3231270 RepID=UPI0034576148
MGPQTDQSGAEHVCARAESSLARRAFEAAERDFLAALALTGGEAGGDEALRARADVGLGRIRLAASDFEQGAVHFRRAHEAHPEASDPLHWLGCAAAHMGAYASADEYFTSALDCTRPHPRSRVQRAYVRARLRRYEEALADLRTAREEDALDADGRWVMAALSGERAQGGLGLLLRKAALGVLDGQGDAGGVEWGGGLEGWEVGRAARLVEGSLSLDGAVGDAFVPLYAVVLVLGGRREAAIELLAGATRRRPADHRITHTLGLALLNSAGVDGRGWEQCVAAWGALLHDDSFWEHRRGSAEARFGVLVEAGLDAGLRADLRELLERRLPESATDGRVPPGALLQREADAARILAGAGGFPAAGQRAPLVGGPLRVTGLGLVDAFGAFAASVSPTGTATGAGAWTGPATGSTQLAYAFSELGFAQLLLKQDKPADALAALTELRCPDCRERAVAAAICEPDCPRFDELNPAYAGHPDKHHRLTRDARALALRARIDLGRHELNTERPDFDAAAASWRRALVHGRETDRYRETQVAVVDLALGAARAAHRAGDPTRAVETLEAVRSITGANERGRLEGQLARLLADRAISAANRDGTLLDGPAADLRRSVAFNPHLLRAQVSLSVVLRGLAARRWRSGSVSGARASLREALDRIDAALIHFPEDPELTEQRDAALADLDHVVTERQEAAPQEAARPESGR